MSGGAPTVRVDIRERIAYLTMARADAANTMDLRFGREFLAAAVTAAQAEVRAVVVTGEGKHFCLGGDLKGMVSAGGDLGDYLSELTTLLHAGIAHLAHGAAPVIAAVNGTAAGAGLGLVLAADLAIAGRTAKFVPAYAAVGLTPDAGCTFLLPRAVGSKRAMEMLLMNRTLDAEQALAWGIVNAIVDDRDLIEHVTALATRLAAGPAGAHRRLKRLVGESWSGFEAQLARESREISAQGSSAEGREGIAAFLEKRSPRFQEPR